MSANICLGLLFTDWGNDVVKKIGGMNEEQIDAAVSVGERGSLPRDYHISRITPRCVCFVKTFLGMHV